VQRVPVPEVASSSVLEVSRDAADARTVAALVVELGAVRVSVQPGFDRGTLAAVLEVAARAGGR
jgi:hypothetical protein